MRRAGLGFFHQEKEKTDFKNNDNKVFNSIDELIDELL